MAKDAAHAFKIRKEDTVAVIAGKDKGKQGRILKILRAKDRVLVEGINIVKKAMKRRNQQDRGGIVELEAPIHSSNLMIVCRKCGPTRIGYKLDGEIKTRVCRKCGEAL
jgi:large subunit ribosomal protein L24